MARKPFQPVELAEALRPVAAPVDTFVTPQTPSRDTNLQDLARSLSGLGGSLAGMVGARDKQAEEDDKIRGTAAAWQANGAGAAEGVAQGLIPAQASPAFMRGYKQVQGEVAGGQLEQQFAAAYDTWSGKSSTDPKAYDTFIGRFIKDHIKTDDPDILRGLLPKVQQVAANYLQRHIGDASKATQAGYATALSAKGEQAIDQANSAGLASKTGTDYAGVFGTLETIRADGLKIGANREQLDTKLIDTVTTAAVTKRDPRLLDFLERKVPGQDYTWSNTPYGRDQKQKTIDTLEGMGRRSIAEDHRKNQEEAKAAKDTVTRETIKAITRAPNDPIPDDLLARGEKVDPDFRVNAIRWRDTIGKGTQISDPEEMLAITTDIINGGGLQRVQRGIRERSFRNPEDLTRAYKLVESMKIEGTALDGILKGGSAKTILDTIKKRTASSKDGSKYFDDGSVTPEGLQAQTDFKLQLLTWRQANPEANAIEQEKAVNTIGADLLKRITQPEFMGTIEYERGGLPGPNTYGSTGGAPKTLPAEAAPAVPPKAPAPNLSDYSGIDPTKVGPYGEPVPVQPSAPAPATPKAQATPEGASAWFNELPKETRSALEMKAAQEKKPLSLKVQEIYQKGLDAGAIKAPVAAPIPQTTAPAATAPEPASQPEGPSPRLRELEGKYSRPGAKRPIGEWIKDPFGINSDRPRAPWWPKKDGEKDEKFGAMQAPDGTPIETASAGQGDRIGQAFQDALDAPPAPDTVRLIGEAFQRAIAGTAKPQGGYSSATLRNDPKAARILDFVAGPESGGNYNAYFGNARSTKDLSAMTLDQVMAWSGNRGTASSATGRYQFMKGTLRGLKQEMGLSGEETFSPALQDRMALQLLNRRGYSQWQAGRITDAQFANRLALEWAALPNITAQNGRPAGVSAYAGDGLNKSRVSPGAVLAALTGRGSEGQGAGMLGRLLGRVKPRVGSKPDDDAGTRI